MYYYNNPYLNQFINGYDYGTQYLYPTTGSPNWYRNNRSATKVRSFSKEEAAAIALLLGIDFNKSKFDLDEFWMGVNTELEHGKISIQTNVTGDDPIITGKIALAHLNEFPDYYKRLKVLEEEAKAYWNK
ncbi:MULTISPECIES: DUF5661 family protein [Heyndrickxia]|nr:hypothetical protein [Heyndrickxia sporothermodurans]MED3656104.1 hypothetical protein [Heyndrickxia sporothermodurans]MED3696746.1 hypothetical protein [Heyndrickxia sporothermodurans]MED3780493.1 hypothetical protein [Heyndrickxia sporothermodurans]